MANRIESPNVISFGSTTSQEQMNSVSNNVEAQGLRVIVSGSPFDGNGIVSLVFNIMIIYALLDDYDIALKNNGLYIMLAIRLLLNIINFSYVKFIKSRLGSSYDALRRYIRNHKYIQLCIYLWLITVIFLLNSNNLIRSTTVNISVAFVFLDSMSLFIQMCTFCTLRRNPRMGLRIMSITQLGGYGLGGNSVEIRSLQTDIYHSDKIITLKGTNSQIALKGDDEIAPECSICLEEYKNGNEIKILPCGHFADSACLNDWLSANYSCPICRYDIRSDSNQDVTAPPANFINNGPQLRVEEIV